MKPDEFAFFNQQLAAMLRDGIPLEGALRQLCADMRRGQTRGELQALEADLAKGAPLAEALQGRRLPELYKRLVLVGVKSGDLPGALTMIADYFQRQSNLLARLKALMVYPLTVLLAAFVLSCFLAWLLRAFIWNNLQVLVGRPEMPAVAAGLWMPPVLIGLALAAALIAVSVSPARRRLRWRLSVFRDAGVAQMASAICLMLKNGVPLDDALRLAEELEHGTRAGREIAQWRQRLASGHGTFSQMAVASLALSGRVFPPLFVWTAAQSGENLTAGFQRAAEIYHARALHRTELLLYSALPCSVLILAVMIVSQIQPVFAALMAFLRMIGAAGS